ncbi:MAG: ribulose-phosphate 3-epimerase [Clostridiales bacterium]|jgi:ribulose-phosphate 3-epimerase|nr:ribulose-phosphate 3-epimerase [Clostridiales bacterium]
MKLKIAPSILASDFSKLGEEVVKIDKAGADLVHIDIMDGHFVPNISIGPVVVKSIRKMTKLPFDVHLMIEDPDKYIDEFVDAGADIITVQVEACRHLHRTLQNIKQKGIKAGIVLNPATPLCFVEPVLFDVDMILLMTVNPGFGGQTYIHTVTPKIKTLREICVKNGLPELDIEVDGGLDANTVGEAAEAGANVIVAGSSVYKAPDTAEMIRVLRNAGKK